MRKQLCTIATEVMILHKVITECVHVAVPAHNVPVAQPESPAHAPTPMEADSEADSSAPAIETHTEAGPSPVMVSVGIQVIPEPSFDVGIQVTPEAYPNPRACDREKTTVKLVEVARQVGKMYDFSEFISAASGFQHSGVPPPRVHDCSWSWDQHYAVLTFLLNGHLRSEYA